MKTIRRIELRARRVPIAAEQKNTYGVTVNGPEAIERVAFGLLSEEAVEVFVVILLDVRNRTIGYHEVGRGGISDCPVDVGSIFRSALIAGASNVILVHNHPSGDPTPSAEDLALTERVRRCGELLGIVVLDHIIVGEFGVVSLNGLGLMSKRERA